MKKVITLSKGKINLFGLKMYQKGRAFLADRRGGAGDTPNYVFNVFIGLLLAIAVYLLFKEQINTFITNTIFGKMNTLS
ncbi:hypothetical protein [Paenibacillus amylolyticus]|uniref:Uncharacterized protein n=1 Tax=Paenibacillus amylolyticus TaxID=1451 RepID=A0ABD8B344_PAEAM